jgi:hypothetical protein
VESLAPASRGVLLANNTAFNAPACFRVWEDGAAPEHRAGQVEVVNNIFFDASGCDMCFLQAAGRGEAQPGDGKTLLRLWRFRHNCRDFGCTDPRFALPAGEGDARFHRADLLAIDADDLTRTRPKMGSPLATRGAGAKGGDLPTYIGALPPEGGVPWDWDHTWRARRAR